MIFFFDRNIGTTIPRVLSQFKLPTTGSDPPIRIEYHQKYFKATTQDDEWLAIVGDYEWIVLGQDSKFHKRPNELAAIKDHSVGCFYLCGANASKWETLRIFTRAYDKIVNAVISTPKPFIFRVDKYARLRKLQIP